MSCDIGFLTLVDISTIICLNLIWLNCAIFINSAELNNRKRMNRDWHCFYPTWTETDEYFALPSTAETLLLKCRILRENKIWCHARKCKKDDNLHTRLKSTTHLIDQFSWQFVIIFSLSERLISIWRVTWVFSLFLQTSETVENTRYKRKTPLNGVPIPHTHQKRN